MKEPFFILNDTLVNVITKEKVITLPPNIKNIAQGSFNNCINLTTLILSGPLFSCKEVFSKCKNLTTLVIKKEVDKLDFNLIKNIRTLKNIKIEDENSFFSFKDGVLYNKEKTIVYSALHLTSSVNLPESVESLNERAFFDCTSLSSFTLPKNIKKVPERCFQNCTRLKSFTFSSSLEEIADDAFYFCSSLSSFSLPSSLKIIGKRAFKNCENVTSLLLPSSLEEIKQEGFSNMKGLKEITLPDSFCNIASSAFNEDNKVETVIIPPLFNTTSSRFLIFLKNANKIKIDEKNTHFALSSSFLLKDGEIDCFFSKGVKKLILDEGITEIKESFFKGAAFEEVVFPSTLKVIKKEAFRACKNIKKICFPPSLEVIEEGAFSYCQSLEKVCFNEGLKEIKDNAFECCERLYSLKFPSSLMRIGRYAFYECSELEKVSLPPHLLEIEEGCFCCCENISSITIPDSVERIGEMSFGYCGSLEEIELSKGVKEIGDKAFNTCESLTSITLPSSLKRMGSEVFNSSSIYEIDVPNNMEKLSFSPFLDTDIKVNADLNYYGPEKIDLSVNTEDYISSFTSPFETIVLENFHTLLMDNTTDEKKKWINYFRSFIPLLTEDLEEDEEVLSFALKYKCLTYPDAKELLEYFNNEKDIEKITLLLSYINENFSDEEKRLVLEDERYRVIKYVDEDFYTLSLYMGDEEYVTIPSMIDGKKIERVGKYAFSNPPLIKRPMKRINKIKSITISDEITIRN